MCNRLGNPIPLHWVVSFNFSQKTFYKQFSIDKFKLINYKITIIIFTLIIRDKYVRKTGKTQGCRCSLPLYLHLCSVHQCCYTAVVKACSSILCSPDIERKFSTFYKPRRERFWLHFIIFPKNCRSRRANKSTENLE